MADVFSIAQQILGKGTDMKLIEKSFYFVSAKIQIPVLLFTLVAGLGVALWIWKGVREA